MKLSYYKEMDIAINRLATTAKLLKNELDLYTKANFNPNQPRVPSGNHDGGQWTDSGGGGSRRNPVRNTRPIRSPNTKPKNPNIGTVEQPTTRAKAGSGRSVIINHGGKYTETRKGGSLAWRNNNPGNLRPGKFSTRHGAVGESGGFSVFPDEATGDAAQKALLKSPKYISLTVDEAIKRRSPDNENDTQRIQLLVRKFTGLSGKEKIEDLNNSQFESLAKAIKRSEGWKVGEVSIRR